MGWRSLFSNSRANWRGSFRNSRASAPERAIGAETKGLIAPISCLARILFQARVFRRRGATGSLFCFRRGFSAVEERQTVFPFGKPASFCFSFQIVITRYDRGIL